MTQETSEGRAPAVTDSQIIDVVEQSEHPSLTTAEIAEHLSIGPRRTRDRLCDLCDDGKIKQREAGGVLLWWSGSDIEQDESKGNSATKIVSQYIEQVDIPGNLSEQAKRRKAVRRVFNYLFTNNRSVPVADLRWLAWGADPDTYADKTSLWNNCVSKALDQVAFFEYDHGQKTWGPSEDARILREDDVMNKSKFNWALTQYETEWKKRVHGRFWDELSANFSAITEGQLSDSFDNNDEYDWSSIHADLDQTGCSVRFKINLGGTPWLTGQGKTVCRLSVENTFASFDQFRSNLKVSNWRSEFEEAVAGSVSYRADDTVCELEVSQESTLHISEGLDASVDWLKETVFPEIKTRLEHLNK